jgi:hypothetical protein
MPKIKVNKEIKTEIICVIDKSGSMSSIKSDAIGGFNEFLKEQKEVKDDTKITVNLFDSNFSKLYNSLPINEAVELDDTNYRPSSMTALYDAIGKSINEAEDRFEKDGNPDRVLVVILTDGKENRSQEYDQKGIFKMIEEKSDKDWEFIFLAANQDAMETATSLNIKGGNSMNFAASGSGVKGAYAKMSSTVKSYRSSSKSKFDNLDDFDSNDTDSE